MTLCPAWGHRCGLYLVIATPGALESFCALIHPHPHPRTRSLQRLAADVVERLHSSAMDGERFRPALTFVASRERHCVAQAFEDSVGHTHLHRSRRGPDY